THSADSCKEYDLVLPGVSSSISFYVKLKNCNLAANGNCLSVNHFPDTTFGTTDFNMEFRSQLNDLAHSHDSIHVVDTLKYLVYGCGQITEFIHCAGTCDGLVYVGTSDFSSERNTFGWPSDTA